jgi:gluconolactonase
MTATGSFEFVDKRFRRYALPVTWVEKLHEGTRWAEGPVYFADLRCLVWSDIPNSRMLRWDEEMGHISLFRADSNHSNGNTRDRQGRLVTCEHGARRVTRTEWDGKITVLADRYRGKRLNSPNDVVVKSDNTIWFTDPPYGILSDYEGHKAESEIGACNVYRFDPRDGSLKVVAGDFVKPNGLAFSADEQTLYIADSGRSHDDTAPHHVRSFKVGADSRLSHDKVFTEIEPGIPDGVRVDVEGNLWVAAGDGVHCYSDSGALLGKIYIPEAVANLTFGGPRRNRLFIAATTSLYSVFLGVSGVQAP